MRISVMLSVCCTSCVLGPLPSGRPGVRSVNQEHGDGGPLAPGAGAGAWAVATAIGAGAGAVTEALATAIGAGASAATEAVADGTTAAAAPAAAAGACAAAGAVTAGGGRAVAAAAIGANAAAGAGALARRARFGVATAGVALTPVTGAGAPTALGACKQRMPAQAEGRQIKHCQTASQSRAPLSSLPHTTGSHALGALAGGDLCGVGSHKGMHARPHGNSALHATEQVTCPRAGSIFQEGRQPDKHTHAQARHSMPRAGLPVHSTEAYAKGATRTHQQALPDTPLRQECTPA